MPKRLHLGAIMRPVGIHTARWCYPGAYPDANFNLKHLVDFIRALKRARFDTFFMADHLAVLNMPVQALRRSATATSFEPFTLLSALAMAAERIGLIATASTTFDEPYHLARRFASLDHISNGRAGRNVVTYCATIWMEHLRRGNAQVLVMPPMGSEHSGKVNRLTRLLLAAVGDRAVVAPQNPVRLSDLTEPQPDFALLKPRDDDYQTATPGPDDVLVLIEVASTCLDFDRGLKRALYARRRIPEFWIVNLSAAPAWSRSIASHTASTTYRCRILDRMEP